MRSCDERFTTTSSCLQASTRPWLPTLYVLSAMLNPSILHYVTLTSFTLLQTTRAGLPFETRICLGSDWDERQNTLLTMKDAKLRDSLQYLRERTKFLDPAAPFAETSRFMTPSGDYCVMHVDITPFEGLTSARPVYDALQDYFFNMEISISELLGQIMIRENVDSDDNHRLSHGVSQNRFVSTLEDSGVQIEMNAARFSAFHEATDAGERAFGVITGESIDNDALFPYAPADRLRQDVTAVLAITHEPRKKMNGQEEPTDKEEELVVMLTRVCLLKLRRTDLEFPSHVMQDLHESVGTSIDVMLTKTREFVGLPPSSRVPV